MPILEANQLTRRYQMGEVSVTALDGIDLTVAQGEFVAIMGPSGSGKSTLLHLLGGLDIASGGEIRLGGERLTSLNDDDLTLLRRRKIGFIFQFFNLIPTLSAEENIVLPLLLDGQLPAHYHEKIDQLLELVGLTDRRHHRPSQLSGGQQQRVAIARAFANDPQIVLADEPTGNLDSRTGVAVLELLRRTCTELEATIVMVTHDPKAASFADRVIFLKDGAVVSELRLGAAQHPTQQIIDLMAQFE
jgi:putative ABC transport system ATP-binding protein